LILLSLLILLALTPPAMGGEADRLEKVYEVKNGEFLGSTNLVVFRNEPFGMAGIMGPDGTVLVPNEYYDLRSDNPWGYVYAAKLDQLNGRGLINTKGEVLIPFEYGELEVLSAE
jgi:hypothetical protein